MRFEDLLQQAVPLPSSVHYEKVVIEDVSSKYTSYKNNSHHWTTKYCWENFIPHLMAKLEIAFDKAAFEKVPYIWSNCDFSYHKLPSAKFKIADFNGNSLTGDHDALRAVNSCPLPTISMYHSLFRLSHQSGKIDRLDKPQ